MKSKNRYKDNNKYIFIIFNINYKTIITKNEYHSNTLNSESVSDSEFFIKKSEIQQSWVKPAN